MTTELSPQEISSEQAPKGQGKEEKLLTFLCNNHEYGIPISEAREVIGMMDIDYVPQTPDCMVGVINLRGKIVPVISLRKRLLIEEVEPTQETCIMIVEHNRMLTGIVVDFLVGVVDIQDASYKDKPELGDEISHYIKKLANLDKRVIIIFEVESLIHFENSQTNNISQ